jgi:predicted DNA-binding transcriptional regulator YafY
MYAVAEEVRRRSPAPVSAAALAERFGVSRRTIERDLASLADAGVPLYALVGRGGGHVIEGRGQVGLTLSGEEVVALVLAVGAAQGSPYADAALAATSRLLDVLPAAQQEEAAALRSRIRVLVPSASDAGAAPPSAVAHRVLAVIEEGVRVGGVVRLTYTDGDGRVSTRAVEASGFLASNGHWYLVAWCRLRDAGRVFRLDRISRATLTRERTPPRDLDDVLGWVPGDLEVP